MNKYLVVATDERSYLDLKNVVLELKDRGLPYFFLFNDSPHRIDPRSSLQSYSYDTNIEPENKHYFSQTLGFKLPFKPTVLLITNENWDPEKVILSEFKQWGCFIGCIENSSWIFNNIKTKLEIASRKSFPSNCIDVFFDHSTWCLETKTKAGWWPQKSIITGNPKFDDFSLSNENKNIIIIYGSMEREHHYKLIDIYNEVKSKHPTYEVYYKPHPSENKDFQDLNNIDTLDTHNQFLDKLKHSTYNIGMFSSVMYHALLLGKTVIDIDFISSGFDKELEIDNFRGHEFNFWKNILNFDTFEEFKDFISLDYIKNTQQRNNIVEQTIKTYLDPYNKNIIFTPHKNSNQELLKYFDDYNDGKASKRIVDYIEQNEEN